MATAGPGSSSLTRQGSPAGSMYQSSFTGASIFAFLSSTVAEWNIARHHLRAADILVGAAPLSTHGTVTPKQRCLVHTTYERFHVLVDLDYCVSRSGFPPFEIG